MAIEKFNKNMAIIAALDDEPNDVGGMTSAELKNKFDEGGKALQTYMNETLIPALENLGVETAVLLPQNKAGFKYIRLNSDKVLEVSTDGDTWQATGSSGHLIIGPDGQALPQRSRMQFTNGTVTDQNGVTVVTGVKGDKGEKGDKGDTGDTGATGAQGPVGPAIVPSVDINGVMSFSLQNVTSPPQSVNVRGPQGPQGVQGVQGPQGDVGPEGPQGPAGVKGTDGKSAYQTAVEAGYSGTETAFNTALKDVPGHIANDDIHVTAEQKTAWNGSVRYDAAQDLTSEQKAQARGNINSAPGGFGWGDSLRNVLASDAEDTYETYCGKLDALLADMPDGTSQLIYTRGPASTGQYSGAGNIVAVLSKLLGTSASLIGISPDPRGTTNGLWRMLKDNGVWQPVEWINPPMELGTEYRTTERYLGKPVYVKVVECGHFAAAGTVKEIMVPDGNAEHMVGCTGRVGEWQIPTTLFAGTPADTGDVRLEGRVDDSHHFYIYLYSKAYDLTTWQTIVTIKYTKTTD